MNEKFIEKPISDIIHESFIEYAREVIEDRAIPDVRDGLKPVQRRILYTMLGSGFTSDKPFRKSAATVGETLKNLHPHGDASIYNAMVKLSQDFNKRYPLIEGHGNFGTIDDKAAAMRYTESRLSPIAMEMLKDIKKDTVEWKDNYDDTMKEPVVLPSMFPNLIVNGGTGIAVGLASNIPPHNLGEIIDGILAYMKNDKINIKELLKYIKGPDFPTGGIVCPKNLLKCYEKGKGSVAIRAKSMIEELPNNKKQIVITDLPYQTSKNNLLKKITEHIENRKEDDVVEIRDETDKTGNRIVIEMDRGGDAEQLLKELYDKTNLETNFNFNMVALVDNKPLTLSLKDIIVEFIRHGKDIIIKRTKFDLKRARARLHIVEGLIRATDLIDEIIRIIRKSRNPKTAQNNLMRELSFTKNQAEAILNMRLQKLTNLEARSLIKEEKELKKKIKDYEGILSGDAEVFKEMKKELLNIKRNYGDERKTIVKEFDKLQVRLKIDEFTLQVNDNKSVKKLAKNYKGNKGLLLKTDSTKSICLFDEKGKVLKFTGVSCPSRIDNKALNLCNEDSVKGDNSIIFVTSDGQVKKSFFEEYLNLKGKTQGIRLNKGAKVVAVFLKNLKNELVLVSKKGYVIRFNHEKIREVGRIAYGVKGMKLDDDDYIIGAINIDKNTKGSLLVETDKGLEEKIDISDIKLQNRGGKGNKFFQNVCKVKGTS